MSTGLTLRPLADEERDTIGRHTHSRTASARISGACLAHLVGVAGARNRPILQVDLTPLPIQLINLH